MSTTKPTAERLLRRVFAVSAVFLALCYGVLAGMWQWFPYSLFQSAVQGFAELRGVGSDRTWYYKDVRKGPPPIGHTGRAQAGLNLVTEILADALSVKVMDLDGNVLHRWTLDWFLLWPDAAHVPERLRPQSKPGTHVNGAALLPNGDLVFNFEHLGLLRVDRQGAVVWRLPYQTHHSVHRAADGKLWVCGQKERSEPMPACPNLVPPFVEDTVLVVTPDGKVEAEWSILDLLVRNGRQGLLGLANRDDFSTAVSGDVTHLNHVEPFPAGAQGAFFQPGDVLVSLRNVNTVFVFDRATGAIKFDCTGWFVRQHDPHFVDGNTFSVFDNNTVAGPGGALPSRIVLVSARDRSVRPYFVGSREQPFSTPILGRHQWLPNGNLLVTDSCSGRAFELDRNREVVWWYVNYVGEGTVGAVQQVERFPFGYGGWNRRQ
jgi:hypothetical protein